MRMAMLYEVQSFYQEWKIVIVRETQIGNSRTFCITLVKRYHPLDELDLKFFSNLHKGLKRFISDNYYDQLRLYFIWIFNLSDPSDSCKDISEAKRKEVRGLLERDYFKIIMEEGIPANANVLPGQLIFYIDLHKMGKSISKHAKS